MFISICVYTRDFIYKFSRWSLLLLLSLFAGQAVAVDVSIYTESSPVTMGTGVPTYITVANPDMTNLNDVTVVFRFPDYLGVFSKNQFDLGGDGNTVDCPGSTCSSGELVTINLNTIAAGRSVTVGFEMLVSSSASVPQDAQITIDASVRVGGVERASAEHNVTLDRSPNLKVSIDNVSGVVKRGNKIIYSLNYAQIGAAPLQTSTLQFTLAPGTQYVSATGNPSLSGDTITWNTGALDSQQIGEQQVVALIADTNSPDGTLLSARALFTGQDSGLVNHEARVKRLNVIDSSPAPNIVIDLHDERSSKATPSLTRVTVTNPNDVALSNVTAYIRYPYQMARFSPSEVDPGGDANQVTCPGATCDPGELIAFQLKRIGPGAGQTFSFWTSHRFASVLDGMIVPIDANVRVDGQWRNSTSSTYLLDPVDVFSLSVHTDKSPARTGRELAYTLDYANISSLAINQAELVFPLPVGTNYLSATDSPSLTTGLYGSELRWNLETLHAGEIDQKRVLLQVPDATFINGDILRTETRIVGQNPGFVDHELQQTHSVRIFNAPNPKLSFDPILQDAKPGDVINLAATVSNPTGRDLTNISVLLRYPSWFNFLSNIDIDSGGDANTAICQGSSCTAGELLTIDLNALRSGEVVTLNLATTAAARTDSDSRLIPLHATVRVNGLQKSSASNVVKINPKPFYHLRVDAPNNPIDTGVQLRYRIVYGNLSALTTNNSTLQFPIPAGMDYLSSTGGNLVDNVVVWNLGALSGGETYTQEVVLQANTGEVTEGMQLSEHVVLSGIDANTVRNRARYQWQNTVSTGPKPALAIIHETDPVAPGIDALPIELRVTNPTSTPMRNVTVHLRYPNGVAPVRATDIDTGGAANTVACGGTTCNPGESIVFDLNTIPAGDDISVQIPARFVNSNVKDGTLIPILANGRINGVQQVASVSTVRVDRSVVPINTVVTEPLTVGTANRGKFGWQYGTSNNGEAVRYSFDGAGEDLLLTVRGYDIDDTSEVTVWLNNVQIGNLIRSPNNKLSRVNYILASLERQVSGTNILEFRQKSPGFKYGVTNVKLRPTAGPVVPMILGTKDNSQYGYRYQGTSGHPGVVPMTFTGGVEDLFLSLVGYDIDTSDEVSIWLNSQQIGTVKKGRNNSIAPVTRVFVPLSAQTAGTNSLRFVQLKVGNVYGIKNVFLRPALGPVVALTVGERDAASYGYRFGRSSLHATRLQATFGAINDDVRISVRAYDIDTSDEVSVYLNGTLIGNLRESGNLKEKSTAFNLPQTQIQTTNVLEFRQSVPGNRWGIRNLHVRPAP